MPLIIQIVIASVFGGAIGVLLCATAFPRAGRLPNVAAVAILLIGLAATIWWIGSSPYIAFALGVAALIGGILTSGVVWEGHPLLDGVGYWQRVLIATTHSGALRETILSENDFEDSATTREN
ncbi:hypothetical protein BH09ACT1_BH09ACT1_27920 [soil metagenome]